MSPNQILEMIAINREYIKQKSSAALQNLPMLHRSFAHIKDDRIAISLALNDSYAAAIYTADYTGAIRISARILSLYKNSTDLYLIACHESVIGRCYTYVLKFDLAEQHLQRAEEMAFALTDGSNATLELQADVLHKLAMNTLHSGGEKSRIYDYLLRAISILEPTGLRIRLGVCVMSLGTAYMSAHRYDDALEQYLRAEHMLNDAGDTSSYANLLCTTGLCYIEHGQYDLAESYIRRGLEIRTTQSSYGEIAAAYYSLYQLYRHKGEMDAAYETLSFCLEYARIGQAMGIQHQSINELEEMAQMRGDAAAVAKHRDQRQALLSTST